MFDVLGYTDCRADQSLNGATGFQFCAASAGVGDVEQRMVRPRVHRWAYGLAQVPPEQHPETFRCWAQDGAYILLRGRSLARRTASGRDGNAYSLAALTRDEWDILPSRPAQLWSAPDWPSSEVYGHPAPWPTPLALDPGFEPVGLQAWVREQPWAVEHLAHLLTMVEMTSGPHARKLLIEHEDQSVVVRWISLAQLTLSEEEALSSSVHSFAEDPATAPATFIGVHPLLSDGVRPDVEGYRLFDPLNQRCTPVEPSDSSRRHAHWFLTMDADEALTAISTSRTWARVLTSSDPDGAARLAGVVLLGDGQPSAEHVPLAADLLGGLCREDPESVPEWGEGLVSLLQECSPATAEDVSAVGEVIWELDRVAETGMACRLACLCLSWGVRSPDLLTSWLAEHVVGRPPLSWPEDDADSLRAAADSATTLAGVLPGHVLPDLWTLLGDLGLLDRIPAARRSRLLLETARGWRSAPPARGRRLAAGRGGGGGPRPPRPVRKAHRGAPGPPRGGGLRGGGVKKKGGGGGAPPPPPGAGAPRPAGAAAGGGAPPPRGPGASHRLRQRRGCCPPGCTGAAWPLGPRRGGDRLLCPGGVGLPAVPSPDTHRRSRAGRLQMAASRSFPAAP